VQDLTFYGHEVFDGGMFEGEEISLSAPREVKGSLSFRSDHQVRMEQQPFILNALNCEK
jgi:uncharacterized protein YqhQ